MMVAALIRVYDALMASGLAHNLPREEREVFIAELAFKIVVAERG